MSDYATLLRVFCQILHFNAIADTQIVSRQKEETAGILIKESLPLSPFHYCHLTTADPQLRPAPKPQSTTMSPFWTRPPLTASSKAIGIEAAEVLP